MFTRQPCFYFFFFNDTATTEIYTLSLHDALPISQTVQHEVFKQCNYQAILMIFFVSGNRSEEHTSELQSPCNLVCRLLLEKKKNTKLRLTLRSQTISSSQLLLASYAHKSSTLTCT